MFTIFINSIAGSEIILILLFVLVFFGAKSIPGMSRALGRGIRHIKDASQEVQDEIRKSTKDMRADMGVRQTINDATKELKAPLKDVAKGLTENTTAIQENVVIPGSIPHIRKNLTSSNKEKSKNKTEEKQIEIQENQPNEDKGVENQPKEPVKDLKSTEEESK